MSEKVPRTAPINNQGDAEVYTQYRQWPFNSTDMDGGNKTEGNQPNAYPGDEDAEDIGREILLGSPDEFKQSGVKKGILLRNNKVIWDKYGSNHGTLHGSFQSKFNKKPFSYDFYNLRVKGDQIQPIRYQKVIPHNSILLSNEELESVQKILPQFKVVKDFRKEKSKSVPSFMDFYKNKFKGLFHSGDEEEKA